MLDHRTSLNKFENTEIIASIFSEHNGYETRNQLPEENWENHKYVAIKQRATE